jgi:hypothetical protein
LQQLPPSTSPTGGLGGVGEVGLAHAAKLLGGQRTNRNFLTWKKPEITP